MKYLLTLIAILLHFFTNAQAKEEIFDYSFKPTKAGGYYFVSTEPHDTIYKRKAWYLAQKTLYMEGWYLDAEGRIPHGNFKWYHTNRYLHKMGRYVNGQMEGTWLTYSDEGHLVDSAYYEKGRKKGVGLSWNRDGDLTDSTYFDGQGNGAEVNWYNDGTISAAGLWMNDTLKRGRWKYYHRDGSIKATEDYDAAGRLLVCQCYDTLGVALDTAQCSQKEASVNVKEWKAFLVRHMQKLVEKKAEEGIVGNFTVVVRFIVEKDGSLSDVTTLTNYGHGIEDAVLKMFERAPRWKPGYMFGAPVRSYHTQPISFVIQ